MTALEFPRFDGNALCAEVDGDLMFPEQGGDTRAAKKVCARCEIRPACLEWALKNREAWGVWGGKSERQRRQMRQRRAS